MLKKGQGNANSFSQNSEIHSISVFIYSSEEEVTFVTYFCRYEDGFQNDCTTWSEEKKFGQSEREKYANYILPRNPGEISFKETVLILKKNCGEISSQFNTRWQCLKLTKKREGLFYFCYDCQHL